jgi:hypothetical protein
MTPHVQCVGRVRIPLAGPYRPTARLFQFPDGRLLWHVRLWEVDRAVPHMVSTSVLVAYARRNGLHALEAEIAQVVHDARPTGGARE